MKNFLFFFLFSSLTAFGQLSENFIAQLNAIEKRCPTNSEDKRILNLLNALNTELLQSDEGILTEQTTQQFNQLITDTLAPNYTILFLFTTYQNYIDKIQIEPTAFKPQDQQQLIGLLVNHCLKIYNQVPEIVLIYATETLLSSGNMEKTIENIELYLQFYPKSIPLRVYNCLVQPEKTKKTKSNLLKTHPNHWMVKSMLNN